MKQIGKIIVIVCLCLLIVSGLFTFSLRFPGVQNYVAKRAVAFLSYRLGTSISISHFEWTMFRDIDLRDFYMADRHGDTLIYAHTLNASISYWSLLHQRVRVESIHLDGAHIYLHTDSIGKSNIEQLFNSADTVARSATPTPSKPFGGDIALRALSLTHTTFIMRDDKGGTNVSVSVADCAINVHDLALKQKHINLANVAINGVYAHVINIPAPDSRDSSPPVHFLPPGWAIHWDALGLTHATFQYDNPTRDSTFGRIDYAHLLLSDIRLIAGRGSVIADTIQIKIADLHANEKSGFELRSLRTIARISNQQVELDSLNLVTPNSQVRNYLAFNYHDFRDFKKFNDKVSIHSQLRETKIALRDMNYFFKGLETVMHNTVRISGDVNGPISDMRLKKIAIQVGDRTYLRGNFFAHGLPKLSETSLNLRIDEMSTDVADIRRIYPSAVYPPNFNTLGHIVFNGDFDGFTTDFVTRGVLSTDIGSSITDINFKYNAQTAHSAYSGDLALQDFNLGLWFGDPATFGKVTLHTMVKGSGLKLETLNATLDGQVDDITLLGYDYKGLIVNGKVKGKYFSGNFAVNDPNLHADFNGTVDIGKAVPEFHFASSLHHADLYALHLSPSPLILRGVVDADFKGKKPDDMVGHLNIHQLHITRNKYEADIHDIKVSADILPDGQKKIALRSDNAEADILGRFSFQALPTVFRNYLNYTVTKNFEDTSHIAPQQFNFEVRLFDSSSLWRLIDSNIKMVRNSIIKGEFSSQQHIFNLRAAIPEFSYSNIRVKNFALDGHSQGGKIDATLLVDKVLLNDSLIVDTLVSHSYSEGDEFRFDVQVADAKSYNRADVTAYLTPLRGSVDMRLLPSEVWLGGNRWSFAPGNKIHIKNKRITTEGLLFGHEEQSIQLDAYLKDDTSTSLRLTLNETSVADFMNILSKKESRDIHATINGTATIEDIFSHPNVQADIEAREVVIGKIPIGNLKIKSELDDRLKRLNLSCLLISDKSNVSIAGYYALDKKELHVNADLGIVDLNFLNHPFFIRYVKDVRGTVGGKVNISGPLNALNLSGMVKIHNVNLTVSYINTQYTLDDEDIEIGDGYFDIGTITVKDRFNHTGIGMGRIYHDHLRNITLDLHVNTPNMEFLNTTAKDLPIFYGNALGSGKVDFTGIVPIVNIRAYATVSKGTHCYIPINSSYETNRYSFYRYVNSKRDTIKARTREIRQSGVNFILDLDVNPSGVLDIVLDPAAGDVLTSSGRGNLKIEILRTGEFNIYGQYEIERGSYLFTLQNIINKRFDLEKGGTITFNGDVYRAVLNADASYQVRTSTYDLISDLISTTDNESQQRAKSRIVTDLQLKLRGILQNPDVKFDIKPIDPDPLIRTLVDNKISIVRNNETELNKQVFGLLVMNRFLPTSSGLFGNDALSSGKAIGGNVANTVSEFLTSQLSLYMSNFFDNINVKDLDVNFNFQQYDQTNLNTTGSVDNLNTRRELQLALTKRFLNNRLSVNVGGNLDFGATSTTQPNAKSTYVTGDFQIEYSLDKNGVWRAKAFNKNDYDNFNQRNRNRTGVGLSFRKDFDNWLDIFRRRSKTPKPQPIKESGRRENVTPIPQK